jgi:hypothetical protein
MLDLFGIMFSSILMLFVIVRAVQLDRVTPWFQPARRREAASKRAAKGWAGRRVETNSWRRT